MGDGGGGCSRKQEGRKETAVVHVHKAKGDGGVDGRKERGRERSNELCSLCIVPHRKNRPQIHLSIVCP